MKRPLLELALILAVALALGYFGPMLLEVGDKPAIKGAESGQVLIFGDSLALVYYVFADSLCLGLVNSWYRVSLEAEIPDGVAHLMFVPFGDTVIAGIQASGNFVEQGKALVLFPNPSKGRTLDYYSADVTWIRFYNVAGLLVHNQLIKFGWGTITFPEPLASGVYFWHRGNGDIRGSIVVVK